MLLFLLVGPLVGLSSRSISDLIYKRDLFAMTSEGAAVCDTLADANTNKT